MSKTEENLNKWLDEHQPDGYGNGSVGESQVYQLVRDIKYNDSKTNITYEAILKACDTYSDLEFRLRELHKEALSLKRDIVISIDKAGNNLEKEEELLRRYRKTMMMIELLEHIKR